MLKYTVWYKIYVLPYAIHREVLFQRALENMTV